MSKNETPRIQMVKNNAFEYFTLLKNHSTDKKKKKLLKDSFETLYESIKRLQASDVGIFDKKVYEDYHIFIPIFECELFTIWLFHLPKGNGLPLHVSFNQALIDLGSSWTYSIIKIFIW